MDNEKTGIVVSVRMWITERLIRSGSGIRLAASAASALVLVSAFPPFHSAEAAWFALVPLLFVTRYTSPRCSFGYGFFSGLVFWLVSLSWLLRLAGQGVPLCIVALGWVSLSAYCAVFTGVFAVFASVLFGFRSRSVCLQADAGSRCGESMDPGPQSTFLWNLLLLALIPVVWTGVEYARGVAFTGFPWNGLGVSQFRNLAVIQVAEWGGAYLVSAFVVLLNASFMLTAERLIDAYRFRRRWRLHVELMVGLTICAVCWVNGVETFRRISRERPAAFIRASAVQPNIPQPEKWSEESMLDIYGILRNHTEYALAGGDDLDIVIWPETAVPHALNASPECLEFVASMTASGVPILVGTMEIVPDESADGKLEDLYFNSSCLVDSKGNISALYRKRHLVPFGEYLPLDKRIRLLRRIAPLGFSCTPGRESTVFRIADRRPGVTAGAAIDFSVLICFEDIFPYLAREAVRNGAKFLVNQTNDGWFGRSAAPVQHMSHCVLRCVENRVGAVRVANTGVTCFIEPSGEIQGMADLEDNGWGICEAGVTTSELGIPQEQPRTAYNKYGDWLFAIPSAILTVCVAVVGFIFRRPRNLRLDHIAD